LPGFPPATPNLSFADVRLTPHYPVASPLEDVLRLIAPGSDEYVTEKYAWEIESLLGQWSKALRESVHDHAALAKVLDPSIEASPLSTGKDVILRDSYGLTITRRSFPGEVAAGRERFLQQITAWLGSVRVETAEFEVTGIEAMAGSPLRVLLDIRYDIVATRGEEQREERVGSWRTEWSRQESAGWRVHRWEAKEETVSVTHGPVFVDVTSPAFSGVDSYTNQMLRGSDYWRTVLDGACGIDVYGNNGVAVGDFNNDGFDDLYVCQPSGLPNRLYRNRGDGTLEDVTEKAGVGVLDNTACALFADFENKGRQDLLVVCGSGPLLFLNQGNGTFSLKHDAFKFERPPAGTFTHAAIADYDGDGKLDIYFCLYSYYLGLDQYHYPVPYFDARNGPPNYLLHNEGNATFVDRTEAAGLNAENDRYSFACAWGSSGTSGLPDLCVANDFGRANLYRNNGNGTFTAVSSAAHIDDPGAGMSASWCDFDNDGKQDVYIADMWSAAGQRVSGQKQFHEKAPDDVRANYQRHARGNALYRNLGNSTFQNIGQQAGAAMGRWSWCSDFWDFDHDGFADLYVANGYISAPERNDLASFFWRQVVGKSPEDSTPSVAYERGWNAINELIRSDHSWNGYERNVMFANNHDGTFSEVSGAVGLDCLEDSRSFVLADLDHDGRLEVVVKNRNAPQLRILHNAMKEAGGSVAFRLTGTKSNRDCIGASVTVEVGTLRQTKFLQAGAGFAAQHTKEIFFGVGKPDAAIRATVRWPGGASQEFQNIPVNHRIAIEEGSAAFAAEPFAGTAHAYTQTGPPAKLDPLPSQIDTWLIEPLKAPVLSLPDLEGNAREVRSLTGGYLLLTFWATSAPVSCEQLKSLQQQQPVLARNRLELLAVNVDAAGDAGVARSFAAAGKFSFPVLFATQDAAGVYNIIYRYLFDRRRDLAIPAAFLIDGDGMIVKLYQGPIQLPHLLADLKAVPTTPADRVRRALPYAGVRYHDEFQRNDFTYGVALFQHGYLDAAAASFEQVIAEKPDNAEAYYNLGTLHLRRNNLSQAREYMEQTVKVRSDYPEAWNNLGMIAAQQGQPEEAVRDFEQSLSQRPNYAIALLNLGNLFRRQGAFDKALALLNRALEIQPDDPETNYGLGMLYAQQDQTSSAADFLQKAIALRPNYPEALNNLGVLFTRTGNYAGAKEQFETCIRVAPNFDQSYINLARLYVMQNDKAKAIEALEQLLRVQPQHPAAQHALEMLRSQP
jgi:tetratricopeptide (TPR) repeat protein